MVMIGIPPQGATQRAERTLDATALAALAPTLLPPALAQGESWEKLPEMGKGIDLQAYHGPFAEALQIPGTVILVRASGGLLSLLQRREERWLYLDPKGEPLDDPVRTDDETPVEAVVIAFDALPQEKGGFASLAALWPELRAAWAEVGIASLFINSGQLLLPLFALLIYDKIALNGLFETLWAMVFGMVIYLLTDSGMRLIRSWSTERIGADLALRSDDRLWSKLVAQTDFAAGSFPVFLAHYRDLTLSRDFVSSTYLLAIADIPFLALYLTVIGVISWPLMLAVMVLMLIYGGGGFFLQRRVSELSKEAEGQTTQKLAFMGESLGSLDVVRTVPGAGAFLRRWRELARVSNRYETTKRVATQQLGLFSSVMQTTTSVVVLSFGVYLIYGQWLSVGKLIACNLLAGRAMAQVASLFAVLGKRRDFVRSAKRMEESLAPVAEKVYTPRPEVMGEMAVIALNKQYEGRPPALENVSLTVKPGERIALLGRPGAGKSTLLRCLAGLCTPDSGQILIDGLSLDDISRFDRVKWLAYKGQDPAIFAGTLEENLRVSGCNDPDQLQKAIWASGLENEFKSGRMSLGMTLEERGGNLSGGQRQKVALARALAQPSRFLFLDEPTLGLDPEGERLLAERLPQLLTPQSVLIMTTHSPTMIKGVQRVIALDAGKVVADGPREKLVTLS
ncbi:MAG: hypothetical protein C0621_10460 [Desulfuromonas sp.]|nr:MAG: hypothetical protein C0621_10460 [Desulfuromonas sp.]